MQGIKTEQKQETEARSTTDNGLRTADNGQRTIDNGQTTISFY